MIAKGNQNIFDFTLQEFGTLENLFDDVLVPNSLNADSEIKQDQEININALGKGNDDVKMKISEQGLSMTNGEIEAKAFPSVLEDGNTVKWFDYLENVTKDGSDLVSSWDNKTGIHGAISGALLQAIGTNQPLWSANGILFDGLDNFMKTVAFTLIQPEQIYIVFKQITWTFPDYVFDGNTANSGAVFQNANTPELTAFAGALSAEDNNLPVDTYGIARVLFNGASSKLIINESTPITGNFGASNMGGFTLGARADAVSFGNIEVKEILIRKIADTAQNEQIIYDYLANRYSI